MEKDELECWERRVLPVLLFSCHKALGQTSESSLDGFHKLHSTGGGGVSRIRCFGDCLNNMTQNVRWMGAKEAKTGERLVQSQHRHHTEDP